MNNLNLSRHAMREKALQALFSLSFNKSETMQDALTFALLYDRDEEDVIIPPDLEMFVNQVLSKQDELDDLIEPHLKNWTLQRLAKIDLLIMRMALVEMLGDSVPNAVAINEAIQLAKQFTTDKSRKFINAVLANILKEIEQN